MIPRTVVSKGSTLAACRLLQIRHFAFPRGTPPPVKFNFKPLFQEENPQPVEWRKVTDEGVSVVQGPDGLDFLKVEPSAMEALAERALVDVNHLFRPAHLKQVAAIMTDPEASENDRFVALELLKNANISASGVLPSCQDTGTAIAKGYRGERVLTGGKDEEALSKGIYNAYTKHNLRYSQVAPQSMFSERNTGCNLPAQLELYAGKPGHELEYKFLFVAKGGGSANKTQLFQKTKAVLREDKLEEFLIEEISNLGTAACPPYHLTVVIGGLSAEQCLTVVKMASCKYLDSLPTSGDASGRAFRDLEWEERLKLKSQNLGIGAQFGGKYFVHDVRVVRLPRHGASLPVGLGLSCSADRQAMGKITPDGVFIEALEKEPSKYMPNVADDSLGGEVVKIDLGRPMAEILKTLTKHPVKTRVSLTGTIVVARDMAHARLQEILDKTGSLPSYFTEFPVYYAGPAKKPSGLPSGSFGPTTSGRMDPYVDGFQKAGGSMVMIGKGNRSNAVTEACKKNGGFYLGSIGGAAAILAEKSIKKVEVLDMAELGMEAVWKIDVEDFPAFIIVDDKGNDFFRPSGGDSGLGLAHDAKFVDVESSFDEIDAWFHDLDEDRTGEISREELQKGLNLSDDMVAKLWEEAKEGEEGGLDLDDFRNLMYNHPELEVEYFEGGDK